MPEITPLLHALEQQREESREQFSELRNATASMAKSVSELTALVARSEERHLRHDDGMKRMGKQVDDHEIRLRSIESGISASTGFQSGSWKTITIVATVVATAISILIPTLELLIK